MQQPSQQQPHKQSYKQQRLIAPELDVEKWLNTESPLSLEILKGQVVLMVAFQMLCPGCVEHCLPQAKKVHALFQQHGVAVIGIHTVFEHHAAMTEVSLKAFLHEYRITFPIAIDQPADDESRPLPKTMSTYQMSGTPTLVLIDKAGYIRKHKMGQEHDLVLGAEIMRLLDEELDENL